MGRVFVVKAFDRWSTNHDVNDEALLETIRVADQGIVAARLGGGLVKLRIAREGEGKSSGFRTIVALLVGKRSFYLFGFAKNEQDNIDEKSLSRLKAYGKALQGLSNEELAQALESGEVREIEQENDNE